MPEGHYYRDFELKDSPLGRDLLACSPERSRLIVKAAVEQAQFWHYTKADIQARAGALSRSLNLTQFKSWPEANASELMATTVAASLLRRALPLERTDIVQLFDWIVRVGPSYTHPLGSITKAFERYAETQEVDADLGALARRFADVIRRSYDKDTKRLATRLDRICAVSLTCEELETGEFKVAPKASPAGDALVLLPLKMKLGMLAPDATAETRVCGADQYAMPAESPLVDEHRLLTMLVEERIQALKWNRDMDEFAAGRTILMLDAAAKGRALVAAMERNMASILEPAVNWNDQPLSKARSTLSGNVSRLAREPIELSRAFWFDLLLYVAMSPSFYHSQFVKLAGAADDWLAKEIESEGVDSLSDGERYVLTLWRSARIQGPLLGTVPPEIARMTRWIGDGAKYFLVPGECWADAANTELGSLPGPEREKWIALLRHTLTAAGARPFAKWQKIGRELLEELDEQTFRQAIGRWLPRVSEGRSDLLAKDPRGIGDTIHDENANALRGLLWLLPMIKRREGDARLIAAVALSAYRKVPGVGPRAVKVGNAAVYALSEMAGPEAMAQLAMLKVRVRFGTAQKEVEKAFDAAAIALQLPRNEIEELSAPDCGLTHVGLRQESFGDYRVRVEVRASDVVVSWFDGKGKPLKAVPIAVKKDYAEAWKELQGDLKDLQAMLSAQKERLDAMFLEQRTWSATTWRERYIDHPMVGTIARRLIWLVDDVSVAMVDGSAQDVDGLAVEVPDHARIRLWHPADRSVDEVLAWRRRIETLGMVQPFKQAHREVYLVTDAERRTERYSNRFAAHILRQHQFNALCGARRWKNKLRLMVDDEYPPASRELGSWGLRAEFWIEGVGDAYGVDTNEAGSYLRVASDQVRFYRTGAAINTAHAGGGGYRTRAVGPGANEVNEAIRVDDVPPLVFSEIMRDVDLFVGVGSIGNDSAWQDGGREARYAAYWQDYAFGELSGTAVSRKEILERLIPRLKIASLCTLSDRFLVVRGTRRTYKIHLGSGNILMEPNDQYLCIVPDARARAGTPQVYLPFEGDATLSIILSKAFLLADDQLITDSVILQQLGR